LTVQPLPPPAETTLELIGRTPMVELKGFDTGPCRLFVKLESANPGGSIKDRIARSMIEAAEKDGSLKPGGTIVEATAGNTGLGLAQVGILKGYKLLLVVPDKMAREKIQHLRAMGVDVRITRSDVGKGHPEYYRKFGFDKLPGLSLDGVPPEFFFALSFSGRVPQGKVTFHEAFAAKS